jgi:hypothetical protein
MGKGLGSKGSRENKPMGDNVDNYHIENTYAESRLPTLENCKADLPRDWLENNELTSCRPSLPIEEITLKGRRNDLTMRAYRAIVLPSHNLGSLKLRPAGYKYMRTINQTNTDFRKRTMEKVKKPRLTAGQVREIRKEWLADKLTLRQLSRKWGRKLDKVVANIDYRDDTYRRPHKLRRVPDDHKTSSIVGWYD